MEFNERLKLMRIRFKATQQGLANYLDINLRTYQRYEAGTIEPPLSTATSIAAYFDVPVDCLVGNGVFSNWEEILAYKDAILQRTVEVYPALSEQLDLCNLSESQLAHILPALYDKITFDKESATISIHLFLPPLADISAEGDAGESQINLPGYPKP